MKKDFTKRELELITLVSKGLENKDIANELYISIRTVETHRSNIMRKLGVKNFYMVLTFAFENDILKI